MYNSKLKLLAISCVAFLFLTTPVKAQWVKSYQRGLQAMKSKAWNQAANHFKESLQKKNKDKKKTRAHGTIFIEYYPNREIGICYYYLNDLEKARQCLERSLSQTFSFRAKKYMNKVIAGQPPLIEPEITDVSSPPAKQDEPKPESNTPTATLVGERLSIAVLPFSSKGLGSELGSIDILDKLITGFVNSDRFKVIERAQLEMILEEQKLGISGVVDVATAAQIGQGIGVDAVLVGSVTQSKNTVGIDARLIDTETTEIMTARDAYSDKITLQSISVMITDLADKIKSDFPIVHGYVITINGQKLTIDMGRNQRISKGMKCYIYREGAPIVHPVSGEVIGKLIDEICEVRISEVFDRYAFAVITRTKLGNPRIRDKVITK